jgi:hypothetical protein
MIAKQLTQFDILELPLKDRIRIFRTRKKFMVKVEDKIHLVNDLDRLSSRIDLYDSRIAEVYMLNN